MKWHVEIIETLCHIETVETDDYDTAYDIVWKKYRDCDIVLTDHHYCCTEFKIWSDPIEEAFMHDPILHKYL